MGEKYDKAFFERLRQHSAKRRAMEFLRHWRNYAAICAEDGRAVAPRSTAFGLFGPLLIALGKLDVEFLKGLTEAAEILRMRFYSSRDREPINLNKWLQEIALEHQTVAVDVDLALAVDQSRRGCAKPGNDLLTTQNVVAVALC